MAFLSQLYEYERHFHNHILHVLQLTNPICFTVNARIANLLLIFSYLADSLGQKISGREMNKINCFLHFELFLLARV